MLQVRITKKGDKYSNIYLARVELKEKNEDDNIYIYHKQF